MDSVLHIGSIAGVPQELSSAQRRLGMKSDILSFEADDFGYRTDYRYPIKLDFSSWRSCYISNPLNLLRKMPILLRHIGNYDILHFHYSSGLPFGLDFPLWKVLRKKAVIHHHGGDIRNKGERWLYSRLADRIFVSTPDLLRWSKDAIWIPNPIDLEKYSYTGSKARHEDRDETVKILHAPSKRMIKGTEHILGAIDKLKSEGYKIELILVENTPHDRAIEYYKQADIVVDQLLIGWYGMLAQECMALGKPVCVYIRDDLKPYMPFSPVLNTSTENIVENLRLLVTDQDLREDLGAEGRKYVEQVHDSNKIGRVVTDLY
ncbi:MAG: glycosyltransferase family 4 protein [Methanotrichaceae archaeon]